MAQRLLFVGGLGRSGSTLLEKLANELPGTFAVGETLHVWERGLRDDERCGCGRAFSDCPHWQAVGRVAFGGWSEVDVDRLVELRWTVDRTRRLAAIYGLHRGRTFTPGESVYTHHLRAVLLASATVADGPPVLLESSKHLTTAALLAATPGLDVRVLHLVRDPRGVAYSWTKEVARPEADDSLMPRYRPSRTAGRWVTDNLGFETLGRLGVPTMRIRYEDLLAEPEATMRRVAAFVDLPLGAEDLAFLDGSTARVSTPMHSIAGNPMRFGGEELRLRLDEQWRTRLPRRQQALVSSITAPLLARYGYSLR